MNKQEKDIIALLKAMLEFFEGKIKEQGVKQTVADESYIIGIEDSIEAIKEYSKIKKKKF